MAKTTRRVNTSIKVAGSLIDVSGKSLARTPKRVSGRKFRNIAPETGLTRDARVLSSEANRVATREIRILKAKTS